MAVWLIMRTAGALSCGTTRSYAQDDHCVARWPEENEAYGFDVQACSWLEGGSMYRAECGATIQNMAGLSDRRGTRRSHPAGACGRPACGSP